MTDFLPCPFCNHTDIKVTGFFFARCQHCRARVNGYTESETIALWNMRVGTPICPEHWQPLVKSEAHGGYWFCKQCRDNVKNEDRDE